MIPSVIESESLMAFVDVCYHPGSRNVQSRYCQRWLMKVIMTLHYAGAVAGGKLIRY